MGASRFSITAAGKGGTRVDDFICHHEVINDVNGWGDSFLWQLCDTSEPCVEACAILDDNT